ncbi:MAG: chromosome segregation protein SMC [Alphaproteobacteria bacterium]
MHFTKIRLAGFKSFVEPTELAIEPGLTGVVGPNGCGKSNLVEALRWAMGETSAKSLRGGAMDDVIFGGSSNRPARNIAEVVLSLDNTDRSAPPTWNEFTEIEITRRIEREAGSHYRINGSEVRARDVQLLFADMATGAHSTALISQGQIGALIAAKPQNRRALLEEAAGITGLYSRRHEAEIRLRGAETNLTRLDDILAALDTQLQGLKRQARQANRYRTIGEAIRRLEAVVLYLKHQEADADLMSSREHLAQIEIAVIELTQEAAEAARIQAQVAASLPPLRDAAAAAGAELQRYTLMRTQLDTEENRVNEARTDLARRVAQTESDIEREHRLEGDATAALQNLASEQNALEQAEAADAEAESTATHEVVTAEADVTSLDETVANLMRYVAETEAKRSALMRRLDDSRTRLAQLDARTAEINRNREALEIQLGQNTALKEAETQLSIATSSVETTRQTAEVTDHRLSEARATEAAANEAAIAAIGIRDGLKVERTTLARLVMPIMPTAHGPSLLDSVVVEKGYEAAMGAALGEDLDAPTDEAAPLHWRVLPTLTTSPALPQGAEPLARYVVAPEVLSRRLSQIGVVDTAETARHLQSQLQPGQRLVTQHGGVWRWDGFVVTADAETPAAIRLQQKNRLTELEHTLAEVEVAANSASDALTVARQSLTKANEDDRTAREAVRRAFSVEADARRTYNALAQEALAHQSEVAALDAKAAQTASDVREAHAQLSAAEEELAATPDPSDARETATQQRHLLAEARTVLAEKRLTRDRLQAERENRHRRLEALALDVNSWKRRAEEAQRQQSDLTERLRKSREEAEGLARRPGEIAQERLRLLDLTTKAEAHRRETADQLALAETNLANADHAQRGAETALSEARERRIRSEARLEQAQESLHSVAERIRERLQIEPEAIMTTLELTEEDLSEDRETLDARFNQLERERENMGPVNLRAEQETEELETRLDGMRREREDLIEAIARLRQGISTLNREGRERLLASFAEVNKHFQELFVKLFGGGKAHLELVESEDPLEAGLEIMASPPGKRLQTLTLLSGGEKALTALALQFAVFMTNPAPICVLDEVDAPLDDSNVDRFCSLLENMSASGKTRFLVVTHHRMTMSRMDRLFGVTMAERGVSQLVSVDLQGAERLRRTA